MEVSTAVRRRRTVAVTTMTIATSASTVTQVHALDSVSETTIVVRSTSSTSVSESTAAGVSGSTGIACWTRRSGATN